MKLLILEQKFLEFVECGKSVDALRCLRNEITPLKCNKEKIHRLCGYVLVYIYDIILNTNDMTKHSVLDCLKNN